MKMLLRVGAALLGTAVLCSQAHPAPVDKQHAPMSADARLQALYNGFSSWDAKEFGYFQDSQGEAKPSDYLPKVDAASQQRRAAHWQQLLSQLNAIPEY